MAEQYEGTGKISSWAEEDRPREKLMLKGRAALSDAELIAILIGSGTAELSAVDVARNLMKSVDNNLNELARKNFKDLIKNKGIGEARAVTIIAALELGRRRREQQPDKKTKISGAKDVYEAMKPDLLDLLHEEFWILLLNRANEIIQKVRISTGGITGTVTDTRLIFKLAVEHLASAVILIHNHPSGQLVASTADKQLTKQIKEAGNIMEITVLDHVIFTDHGYLSFVESGLF